MKKLLTLFVTLSMLLTFAVMSVNAAEASDAKAKFGAATIDGKISEGEYGTEQTFTKENCTPFAENTADPLPFSYYINWTEEGLFVAIKATLAEADWGNFMPQFNTNPWGIIPSDKELQGLFFSFQYTSKEKITFMLHNHDTVGKAGADEGKMAVLEDIEYKLGADGDATILEFKLPTDLFKVKSDVSKIDASDKKFEPNQSFGFSAFLIYNGKGWAQTTDVITAWDVEKVGLGKITLEAEPTPAPTATPEPADTDDDKDSGLSGGTIAAIVAGVVIIAVIVIYFVAKKKD